MLTGTTYTESESLVVERGADGTENAVEAVEPKAGDKPGGGRTIAIRASTLLWCGAVAVALIAVVVFGWLYWNAHGQLNTRDAASADAAKAEQVATDYAIGSSTIDYKDFPAWVARLKTNTTPQLANKFDASSPALQQILSPLQWTSTAVPITAKVMSVDGSVYHVDVFLNVTSTNAQTPKGGQTTVTYTVTLDKNSGWKVTDVGGMDGALPTK